MNGLKKTAEKNLDTIIFTDKITEKFVQFAFDYSDGKASMVLDVPFVECTQDEKNKLSKMLSSRAFSIAGEETAYQEAYWFEEAHKAVALTQRIFVEVFNSDPDYELNIEIF